MRGTNRSDAGPASRPRSRRGRRSATAWSRRPRRKAATSARRRWSSSPGPRPPARAVEQMKPLQKAAGSPAVGGSGSRRSTSSSRPRPRSRRRSSTARPAHYVNDYWKAGLGDNDARERLDCTSAPPPTRPPPTTRGCSRHRSWRRSSTSSTQQADRRRWLGPRQIPSGNWTRPKVTQHTNVAVQPVGEKNELVSQKMTIAQADTSPPPPTAATSTSPGRTSTGRRRRSWTSSSTTWPASTAPSPRPRSATAVRPAAPTTETIATGAPTAAALNAALWEAAGLIYTAIAGQGRLAMFVPADQLGVWAPLFAPVNPHERDLAGVRGRELRLRCDGPDLRHPRLHDRRPGGRLEHRRSRAAVEVYEDRRLAAGDRAERARRPGRLRRLLHLARRRDRRPGRRSSRRHERPDGRPNREAVGLEPAGAGPRTYDAPNPQASLSRARSTR